MVPILVLLPALILLLILVLLPALILVVILVVVLILVLILLLVSVPYALIAATTSGRRDGCRERAPLLGRRVECCDSSPGPRRRSVGPTPGR